jgi:hypothetical protein
MYITRFKITEKNSVSVSDHPISFSIPLGKNILRDDDDLVLIDRDTKLPTTIKPLARWEDGSIRWVRIHSNISLQADVTSYVEIHKVQHPAVSGDPLSLTVNESLYIVDTGASKFCIDLGNFNGIYRYSDDANTLHRGNRLKVTGPNNEEYQPTIEKVSAEQIENQTHLKIALQGYFITDGPDKPLNVSSEFTFYRHKRYVKWVLRIHNNHAAQHKGGIWDLGDPGSIYLKHLSGQFGIQNMDSIAWRLGEKDAWSETKSANWRLYQASSGGNNYASSNHVNAQQHNPIKERGYTCTISGKPESSGNRAQPVVSIRHAEGGSTWLYLPQFWQNFPKAVSLDSSIMDVALFPEEFGDLFEIQPGESKQHTILLGFDTPGDDFITFANPPTIQLESSYYVKSQAIIGISPDWNHSSTRLFSLIHQGISGKSNFFNKREQPDEYGWRHFGDLWADHETLEHGNDGSLISHYNNQYDPIYGFFQQYILTADSRWLELMDNLSRHVVDIDIYNTDQDRPEFNHGLFWHTDHYLDASTCTHRSISIHHLSVDHVAQSGGGPGDEHCYSTGLMYHYFLTGSEISRSTVLNMAEWITYFMEGTGSFFEHIQKFLAKDIPLIKRLFSGEKLLDIDYQFTRGTGNFINTLLDAYILTNNNDYIEKVEQVIRQSIHPLDEIEARHLMDVESNWSYAVYLQSLVKYIHIKIEAGIFDEPFEYALACFRRYVEWIYNNEYFYLDRPEILEYPNSTWAAQEIRKVHLLYTAATLFRISKFNDKADEFLSRLLDYLEDDKILKSTRVLAILMQNSASCFVNHDFPDIPEDSLQSYQKYNKSRASLSIGKLLSKRLKLLLKAILHFSLKSEIAWIKLRLSNQR